MSRFRLLVAMSGALAGLAVIALLSGSDSARDLWLASVFALVAAVLVAPEQGATS